MRFIGERFTYSRVLRWLAALMLVASWPGLASARQADHGIPAVELKKMGFVTDAGATLPSDGYAQLLISLYVPGNQTDTVMNKCPDKGIWGIDLTNLTKGDKRTTFGVQVLLPGVTAPVNLNPLDFSTTASGFLGSSQDCNLKVNVIRYVSPIYYVRKSVNQQFTISPTYEVTKALNANLQAELNAFLGGVTSLAGVPAASAAPYLAAIKTNLANAKVSSSSGFIRNPAILAGRLGAPLTWRVEGAIAGQKDKKGKKGKPPQDIVLVAQILPVDTIVLAPASGVWTPGAILSSAFNVNAPSLPTATDGTLGGYIGVKASSELLAYANATNDAAADVACGAIRKVIEGMGLSDRNAAQALWAEARQRVITGKTPGHVVDRFVCLQDVWGQFGATGPTQDPVPPRDVAPPPPPGQSPTVAQMKTTTDINDAFARFFVSPAWSEQTIYAEQLFAYPVAYNDPTSILMRTSQRIDNTAMWLTNEFNRDQAILERVGCYAFFDLNSDSTGFAKTQGARSLMLAVGQVGASGSAMAGQEVLIMATFNDSPGGGQSKIDRIDVASTVSDAARQAMLKQLGGAKQCPSGYRPQLLFGG